METTDYKTGWGEKSYVDSKKHTQFAFVNEFKCNKCGKKLTENFLVIERTNFKHRGNETDETFFYHEKCCLKKHSKDWGDFRKNKKDNRAYEKKRSAALSHIYHVMAEFNIDTDELC